VGALVPKVLSEMGIDGAVAVMQILEHWDAAVGPEVALHARPSVLRGATLEVTADSSVWSQQVQLLPPTTGVSRAAGFARRRRPESHVLSVLRGRARAGCCWPLCGESSTFRRMPSPHVSSSPAVPRTPFCCDFCGAEVDSVRRVALDSGYDRLRVPHQELYACEGCSDQKERRRLGLRQGGLR
jgi:hypothetical protein